MSKVTTSKEPTVVRLKACDRCAAIKQVCNRKDGEDECTRCIRLGICCQITRAHKPMGRPRKWPRKEKVKSDSGSPPALVYSPTSPESSESSFSSSESDVERIIKYDRSLPPTSAGLPISPGGLKDKRTRSGCMSCKIRRKKCDESYPKCGDCSRLKLSCERRTRSTMSPECTSMIPFESPLPSTPGWHDMIPDASHISIFCPTIFPIATSSEEKNLLQHYAVSVSRSLSVVPDEINPFLSLFMQLAMSQTAMRYALLGLSASHLRRIHPSFETVMTKYLAMAMEKTRGLLNDAQTSDEAAIEGLATILVLCLHEICEGKSQKWQLHLKAAVSLINTRRNCKFPPAVRFLLEAITYFDTIATLSFSKSPLLQTATYPADFETSPTSPSTPVGALRHCRPVTPHALFGTAADLFPIIDDIARLAQRQAETSINDYPHHAFLAHATQIETRLLTWRPVTSINTASDPYLSAKMSAASHSLQWAAVMRLHQLVEGYDKSHPKVQTAVRNILASVSMIPEGDLSESILVFPMLMAGLGAIREEDKSAVRSRMSVMGCAIGFGNVYEAQELVERVWRMEEEQEGWRGSGVPWDVMMMANGQTLIMS